MNDRKWFLLKSNQVTGPFGLADIQSQLQADAKSEAECLVWGQGQPEWLPPSLWKNYLNSHPTESETEEKPRLWKVRVSGNELGSFSYEDMLNQLRYVKDLGNAWLWTEGYNEWKEVYQIHKVLDDLGISRRSHPRVPIMGQLECEGPKGHFQSRALTVSEGGLGATEFPELSLGEKIRVVLKSPNLFAIIHATCEIVYMGNDGYVGLKFVNLSSEYKSAIIEYVKKFSSFQDGET